MRYQHTWIDGESIDLPVGKVVCAGLNYALHVKEMNSAAPSEEPVLFIKPTTAVRALAEPLVIPTGHGAVHHEVEIAILIGQPLCKANQAGVHEAISGLGIALDLTLRDLQTELKKAGRPWEKAKAFDGSCPLSPFVPISQCPPLNTIPLSLDVNGAQRQIGNSAQMLFPIERLLSIISHHFTLLPGDVVLTGTPEGVGSLVSGDQLHLSLNKLLDLETEVA